MWVRYVAVLSECLNLCSRLTITGLLHLPYFRRRGCRAISTSTRREDKEVTASTTRSTPGRSFVPTTPLCITWSGSCFPAITPTSSDASPPEVSYLVMSVCQTKTLESCPPSAGVQENCDVHLCVLKTILNGMLLFCHLFSVLEHHRRTKTQLVSSWTVTSI